MLGWYELGGLELAYSVLCARIQTLGITRERTLLGQFRHPSEKRASYSKRTGRLLGDLHALRVRLEKAHLSRTRA